MAIYSDLDQEWSEREPPPGQSLPPFLLEDEKAVDQSIHNLFLTRFGERFFKPELDADLEIYLHDLLSPSAVARLEHFVFTSLERWEPRMRVNTGKSFVSPNHAQGRIDVYLEYSIRGFGTKKFFHQGDLSSLIRLPTTPYARPVKAIADISNVRKARPSAPIAIMMAFPKVIVNRGEQVSLKSLIIDPQQRAKSFELNWGDGTPAQTSENGIHVFNNEGDYDVRLTVIDDVDGRTTQTQKIIVRQFYPAPNPPATITMRVRKSDDSVANIVLPYGDNVFENSIQVPLVVNGVWGGGYIYLFSSTASKPLPNTELVSFYKDGALQTAWKLQ